MVLGPGNPKNIMFPGDSWYYDRSYYCTIVDGFRYMYICMIWTFLIAMTDYPGWSNVFISVKKPLSPVKVDMSTTRISHESLHSLRHWNSREYRSNDTWMAMDVVSSCWHWMIQWIHHLFCHVVSPALHETSDSLFYDTTAWDSMGFLRLSWDWEPKWPF